MEEIVIKTALTKICSGLPAEIPPSRRRSENIPHAPCRNHTLTQAEKKLAVSNALRYFPIAWHTQLGQEFYEELKKYGHIYMYRFIPDLKLKAYPIHFFPTKCRQAAAVMHMILNNLDCDVAQFPEELVTYGGNGQVFSNWIQFILTMHYLSIMTEEQTLVMASGHPQGLFPSQKHCPRVVITNGMVVPNYSKTSDYENMFALGVTMYGQMTAGSYCYIGPQGIVHGTTLTVLNAGRKYLGVENLAGKVFLTSGLGGMSGAQAKAAVICGCVGVIAECDGNALIKRYNQGWLTEYTEDLDDLILRIKRARSKKEPVSIGYLGNVIDIWERFVQEYESFGDRLIDLASDQTSCHNVFNGGYYPVQISFTEAQSMLAENPEKFKELVEESLRRHVTAINKLSDAGAFFWDYGNAFLLQAQRAGANVSSPSENNPLKFRYPSYVQDIMGDIFSLGFGPFRWVCTSGLPEDLDTTDNISDQVISEVVKEGVSERSKNQYLDNQRWIREAGKHKLVVGSQARILYSDMEGRIRIAKAFNSAVRNGTLKGPVVISRDHHDVSGTDSPYRETSNIYDGSAFTADMAVQNFAGDAVRGATWVAIHNGGGVGWGEVINGGFGLLLDGSEEAEKRSEIMLGWDVSNGVTRRAWSGNENAYDIIKMTMEKKKDLIVTLPNKVFEETLARLF